MDYTIFDMDMLDIPFEHLPPVGDLIISHHPQKRLTNVTWAVFMVASSNTVGPALGLFWTQHEAIRYARSIITDGMEDLRGNLAFYEEHYPMVCKEKEELRTFIFDRLKLETLFHLLRRSNKICSECGDTGLNWKGRWVKGLCPSCYAESKEDS